MKTIFKYLLDGIGWVSDKEYSIWDNKVKISYRACSYDNSEPSETQCSALSKYISNKDSLDLQYKNKLVLYLKERKKTIEDLIGPTSDDNLINTVTCEEIVFFNNGNYALMCSTSWSESGIAILQKANDIMIGPQSIVSSKKFNS